jgi:hypothetical protein
MKIGSLLAASKRRKDYFDEDADHDGRSTPLDFIDKREAETRATRLIAAIGRGNAALVVGVLKHGFSAGCWRIVAALEAQAGSVPLVTPRTPDHSLVSQISS